MEQIKKLNEKLNNLNTKLVKWHRKALRHAMHLEDKLEKIYIDLRLVNRILKAKDYIGAEELLTEILEGE